MSDHVGDDPTPHAGSGAPRRSATQLASDPAFTATYATLNALEVDASSAPYGADPTGSVDAAPGMQAAINAVNAAGGGTVRLRAGTYRIASALTLYSSVRIVGAGRGKTLIKAWNTSNIDLIKSSQFDTLTGSNTSSGIGLAGLSDLTLDGNKANNTSGRGLVHYGNMLVLQNVIIRNCAGDGLYSEWSNNAVAADGCESFLLNVVAHDNGGSGIVWAGSHDTSWVHCIAFQNAAKGFWVKPGAAIHVAVACHSWGVLQQYAWYLESETHLLGCQGEGASVAQVMVGASDTIIKGGKYFGLAGQTMKGILVGDATHASPTGVVIDTKTSNLEGGAVDFTNAGTSGSLDLINFQNAGTVLVSPGTVRGSWQFRIKNAGSATLSAGDALNVPDSMTVRGSGSPANAFSVIGSANCFNINSSAKVTALPNGAGLWFYSDNFSTISGKWEGSTGHILSGGGSPSIAAAAAAGTGATVSVTGNDVAGTITLTTGTTPTSGLQATLTFANAFASAPRGVHFSAESGAAALLSPYTASRSTTAVAIGLANAPAASTAYTFNYIVLA